MRTRPTGAVTTGLLLAALAWTAPSAAAAPAAPPTPGTDGSVVDLGTLGGPTTRATAVNDRGQVVGTSTTADGTVHAFVWRAGVMTDLSVLTGLPELVPTDVNDRGQVVGYDGSPSTGFEYRSYLVDGPTVVDLGEGYPARINDDGVVAGVTDVGLDMQGRLYLWEDGVRRELGGIPHLPAWSSLVVDLNEQGTVLASIHDPGDHINDVNEMGYVWSGEGDRVWLGPLDGPTLWPRDIDDDGRVVGALYPWDTAVRPVVPYVWESGEVATRAHDGCDRGGLAIDDRLRVLLSDRCDGDVSLAVWDGDALEPVEPPAGTRWYDGATMSGPGLVAGTIARTVRWPTTVGVWSRGRVQVVPRTLDGHVRLVGLSDGGHVLIEHGASSGVLRALLWTVRARS